MAKQDDLITAEQAAEIVGRDRRTISRWAEAEILPTAVQFPSEAGKGARLFRRSDVEKLVEKAS